MDIRNNNYILIQGFMVNELKLKGNELLIYAIIYGFSQDYENEFKGKLSFLMSWTNSSKVGVMNCLKSLQEKNLISKHEEIINGIKLCYYRSIPDTGKESLPGGKESLPGGGKESLPIDNIKTYNIYKESNTISKDIVITKESNDKSHPKSVEEVSAYCQERNNNVDPQRFYDYYQSNGWKVGKNPMKDWKACVRLWERNNKQTTSKESHNDYKLDEIR